MLKNTASRILKVTADSGANMRQLKKYTGLGVLKVDFINIENAKYQGRSTLPATAMWDSSYWDGGDLWAPDELGELDKKLISIVGGGKKYHRDRQQLLGHFHSGNDIFLTGDKSDIWNNRDRLKELGIQVLHNDEFDSFIKEWINKSIVPQLRFPEFTDEWQVKKLGDFLIPTLRETDKPKNNYLAVGIRSHFKGTFQKPNSNPSKIAMDKLYEVKADDFIVNITFAWEGALAIANKEDDGGLVSHRFPTYTFDSSVNGSLFRYVYPTSRIKYRLGIASPGGAGRNRVLNKKDFLAIKVSLPGKPEQKKIAEFMGGVDSKLTSIQAKVIAMHEYKKGVMQALFSGKLRFKDENGNPYPDWEEKKLGDIAKPVTTRNTSDRADTVLTNSAVRGIIPQGSFFDKDIAVQGNLANYYLVEKDDFVYNPRISVSAPVGPFKRNNHGQGAMSPLYSVFRFNNQNLDYIEAYFKSSSWFRYMKNVANYGARHDRMAISSRDLHDLPIPYPCQEEQQKIADFLTAIDDKIKLEEAKLAKSKDFKKALLQRMFV